MHRARRLARLVLMLVVVVALAAAGCGSDDSSGTASTAAAGSGTSGSNSGGDAVSKARAVVDAARKPITAFDGPSQSPGKPPSGKSLSVIYPVAAPLPQRASASVKNAAAAVGWTTRLVNAQGTPKGYVDAVEQAISSKVDGIVLVAMPVPLLQDQIKAASRAHIPVVAILPALPEPKPAPEKYGLFDYVTAAHNDEGVALGDWIIQDSPDGADVIRLTSPEFPDLTRESDALAKTLQDAGGKWKVVEKVQSPVTDILGGPQGVQRLQSAMRKQPNAKYMFVLSESWSQIFLQARKLLGRSDVAALGSDGDFSVPLVKKGEKIVMAGPDTMQYGWYAVDALIRAFNDKPAIGGYFPRFQIVDTTNAKDVNGPGITAEFDYQSAWKKLWGIG